MRTPEQEKQLDDLIAAAKALVVTPEMVAEFEARIEAAEKVFDEEARQKQVTQEWLNREYTI